MSSWFDEGSGKEVDVVALLDSGVPPLMAEIVQLGALVSFGTTSDGGSLGITVTVDGRWKRAYFRDAEEATDWLIQARDAVKAENDRPAAPSAQGRRQRRPRDR